MGLQVPGKNLPPDPPEREGRAMMDLVVSARAGDDGAMAELLARLRAYIHERVTKLLFSRKGRVETVSDITQKVITSVWKSLKQFRRATEQQFYLWLEIVIFHGVVDVRRSPQPPTVPLDGSDSNGTGPVADLPARGPTPSGIMGDADRTRKIHEATEQLPRLHHEILTRRYVEMKTIEEIAKDLGISRNAADQRLYKARKALEARLPRDIHDGLC